jgi:hypothetical protein
LHPLLVTPDDELQAIRSDLIALVGRFDRFIEATAKSKPGKRVGLTGLERTKAIERVLQDSGQAMSPVQIWRVLQDAGRDDPKMQVQVTTNDLWHRDRIGRVSRGLYTAKPRPTL